jgi:ribonuclease-3
LKKDISNLEKQINYCFIDKSLLTQAMTHSSYANEKKFEKYESNERLEFLGDAVLELIISEFLFLNSPKLSEGELTKTRAGLVCEMALSHCARGLDLGSYLFLGKGEESTGGRSRNSIISDSLEALIGAIYLDGGWMRAREFVEKKVLKDLENKKLFHDSKTVLQEMIQSSIGGRISYQPVKEEGPDHEKIFTVQVMLEDRVLGSGKGKTKKSAEQEAAFNAINVLKNNVEQV